MDAPAPHRPPVVAVPAARLAHLGPLVAVGAAAILAARAAGDVQGAPLVEDEAVSGLIGARPLGELLHTVMVERHGAPLHYVLTHVAFWIDRSPEALRWLSMACAILTVLVVYDLGRRLAGPLAGSVASLAVATSTLLGVYASFGRIYATFALVGALAADLLVRALDRRTVRASLAAAAACALLPAAHPYGAMPLAGAALVGLIAWRGRPLLPGLAVAAVGACGIPFAVFALGLFDRFAVGRAESRPLASPEEAWWMVGRLFHATAGGRTVLAAIFLAIGVAGLVLAGRRRPLLAVYAVLGLALPPLLLMSLRTESAPELSPRHLIYALPLLAAFVGVAVAAAARRLPLAAGAAVVALAVAGLVAAPSGGVADPRDRPLLILGGGDRETAVGAWPQLVRVRDWLDAVVGRHDVLVPHAAPYLAAIGATGDALTLPTVEPQLVREAVRHARLPIPQVVVVAPVASARVDVAALAALLPSGSEAQLLGPWLAVRIPGPFETRGDALVAAGRALDAMARTAVLPPGGPYAPSALAYYLESNRFAVCEAAVLLGRRCASPG
ncbi:MAG: glycosyltransferase family 39 protein [Thermoleophilia bacterium]